MMREPWEFPREPTSRLVAAPKRQHQEFRHRLEEDAVAAVTVPNGGIGGGLFQASASEAMSSWEENFQDLSGWCMTNARCDFRAGEPALATTELTGKLPTTSLLLE